MCKQATPSTYTMCKQGLPFNYGYHDDDDVNDGLDYDDDDCDKNLMSVPPQRNAPLWRRATIQGNSPFTVASILTKY